MPAKAGEIWDLDALAEEKRANQTARIDRQHRPPAGPPHGVGLRAGRACAEHRLRPQRRHLPRGRPARLPEVGDRARLAVGGQGRSRAGPAAAVSERPSRRPPALHRPSSRQASNCDRKTSPVQLGHEMVASSRSMTGPLTSERCRPMPCSVSRFVDLLEVFERGIVDLVHRRAHQHDMAQLRCRASRSRTRSSRKRAFTK